ncbi:hypothetical protein H072_488 [Dactylellina haptotyla CBS 200.50]|uniref:Uncharacterized protein n=1 Tax=Dactylellina haptotyla (strain CBS 200.50) TaxID=1284197 RepID=S8ARP4_DACHA|nr:hypothetical protein H072_488 [Dactylellina haptotyla CBS 200.50]
MLRKLAYSFLVSSFPLLASAQCAGYNWYPAANLQCGVNYDDGTNLEVGLIPAGPGCPFTFGHTYWATAFYTDINNVVRTTTQVNAVTTSDPATTVSFLYNVPYSSIKNGSPVTIWYVFDDGPRTVSNLPPFTIYNTIAYTDTTTTVPTVVEVSTDSVLNIPSTTTVLATAQVTDTVTSDTATITGSTSTVVNTITITPRPRVIWKNSIKVVTETRPCIPNRYHKRAPKPRAPALEERDVVTNGISYAYPVCTGNVAPATTTLTTNTVVKTSTSTSTFTNTITSTVIVGTSTSTITETDIVSATSTVTITPPPVTNYTRTTLKRQTLTSTHTYTIHKIVYKSRKACYPPPRPPHPKPGSCKAIKPFHH